LGFRIAECGTHPSEIAMITRGKPQWNRLGPGGIKTGISRGRLEADGRIFPLCCISRILNFDLTKESYMIAYEIAC
jgi:hypothetical protein